MKVTKQLQNFNSNHIHNYSHNHFLRVNMPLSPEAYQFTRCITRDTDHCRVQLFMTAHRLMVKQIVYGGYTFSFSGFSEKNAYFDTHKSVVIGFVSQMRNQVYNLAFDGGKNNKHAPTIESLVDFLKQVFTLYLQIIPKYNRCAADKLVVPENTPETVDAMICNVFAELAHDKQYVTLAKK